MTPSMTVSSRGFSLAKPKPFGGMKLAFIGRNGKKDTLESIFGKKWIPPTEMTKRLEQYINRRPDIKEYP